MTYFLYDLLEDPYEMHDLSDKLPLKAKQMKTAKNHVHVPQK